MQTQDGVEAAEVESITGKMVIDVKDTGESSLASTFTFTFEISPKADSDEESSEADADGDEQAGDSESELTGAEF